MNNCWSEIQKQLWLVNTNDDDNAAVADDEYDDDADDADDDDDDEGDAGFGSRAGRPPWDPAGLRPPHKCGGTRAQAPMDFVTKNGFMEMANIYWDSNMYA